MLIIKKGRKEKQANCLTLLGLKMRGNQRFLLIRDMPIIM